MGGPAVHSHGSHVRTGVIILFDFAVLIQPGSIRQKMWRTAGLTARVRVSSAAGPHPQ